MTQDWQRRIADLENELKSSEGRVSLIMANIPVGFVLLNNENIEAANSVIEKMFAISRSRLARQPLSLLFPELEHKSPAALLEKVETEKNKTELLGRRSDGSTFPCELTFVQVDTAGGPRCFAFVSDITERHELEKLKREFVAMLSHDLNAPLSSVKMCLESLSAGLYGELSPDGLSRIALVNSNVERLISLIEDLLCMDTLESGKVEIKRSLTSIKTITEKARNAVLGLSEEKQIRVKTAYVGILSDDCPEGENGFDLDVLLDEPRVVQVMVNLLSNAIKFSPPSSEVLVNGWLSKGQICFAVIDRGAGVSDSLKPVIFEKYKQIGGTTPDSRRKGFGLGLAICKQIVQQHGGKIWVEDTPGGGSTFQVRLPAS